MKVSFVSIRQASLKTGLSQVQIFALLRNNVLKSSVKNNIVVIEQRVLKRWVNRNENLVTELKKDVDNRFIFISLLNYFANISNKRVC